MGGFTSVHNMSQLCFLDTEETHWILPLHVAMPNPL